MLSGAAPLFWSLAWTAVTGGSGACDGACRRRLCSPLSGLWQRDLPTQPSEHWTVAILAMGSCEKSFYVIWDQEKQLRQLPSKGLSVLNTRSPGAHHSLKEGGLTCLKKSCQWVKGWDVNLYPKEVPLCQRPLSDSVSRRGSHRDCKTCLRHSGNLWEFVVLHCIVVCGESSEITTQRNQHTDVRLLTADGIVAASLRKTGAIVRTYLVLSFSSSNFILNVFCCWQNHRDKQNISLMSTAKTHRSSKDWWGRHTWVQTRTLIDHLRPTSNIIRYFTATLLCDSKFKLLRISLI